MAAGEKRSGRIGLILDGANIENKKPLLDLFSLLDIEKKDFKVAICGETSREIEGLEAEILRSDEISISGKFKSEAIRSFASQDFDFLICFFTRKNLAGALLAAESRAEIKIGNKPDAFSLFDVEINTADVEEFQQEVSKYIGILKNRN